MPSKKNVVKKVAPVEEPKEEEFIEEYNNNEGIVLPDNNWDNGINEIIQEMKVGDEDQFGLKPIILLNKKTYTQAHRKAQQRYREKYPDKYCETQRKLYDEKKKDEEWKKKFNERARLNNEKYRNKKKEEMLAQGIEIKKRGRPRKQKNEDLIANDSDEEINNIFVCCRCYNEVNITYSGYCAKCQDAEIEELRKADENDEMHKLDDFDIPELYDEGDDEYATDIAGNRVKLDLEPFESSDFCSSYNNK